jgi:hypothetical protein
MRFLDRPACLDQDGAVRCGLPAVIRCRVTMHSTGGPPCHQPVAMPNPVAPPAGRTHPDPDNLRTATHEIGTVPTASYSAI